jgi:glycosyltransferase involved in cell wall biosynthesis
MTKANPKVSIIIPVYNGANYMSQAIDSALAQTWPNTEVVVVNDGSTDDGATARIAGGYGDRIRYIAKPNGGVASALNAGIEAMTGDIFCWLSHDDLHVATKAEEQVKAWLAIGREDAILYSDYTLINERGAKITDVSLDHAMLESKPLYSVFRGCIHGCSVFVPAHLFETSGLFDVGRPTTQDYDLWFRMLRHATFVHMPRLLVLSRWHAEQGSKKIDHTVEANAFWSRVMDELPPDERAKAEESEFLFYKGMDKFLRTNGLVMAADHALARADKSLKDTLVSVVIPAFNRPEQTVAAAKSALAQTHSDIEVVIVDDGSTANMTPLARLAEADRRVILVRQANKGAAAARNAGWAIARGRYVAFLDSDDLFLPDKIAMQLRAMAETGAAFSHTSYWRCMEQSKRLDSIPAGRFGGKGAYPRIISGCPIATPTVMIDQAKIPKDARFPEGMAVGEDVLLWFRLASIRGVLGIDRALSIVRASSSSAAYDVKKQIKGLDNIISVVRADPEHRRHVSEIEKLVRAANEYRSLDGQEPYENRMAQGCES